MIRAPGLYFTSGDGLLVIFSAALESDGKRWIHVSNVKTAAAAAELGRRA